MADVSIDTLKVRLASHDPNWARIAAEEGARIAGALAGVVVTAHHIGSTAIPGISAKPIVDLTPVVTSLEALDGRQPDVEALGYVWRGAFGIEGRRYCVLEREGKRIFQAHFFAEGHPEIARHLTFRDYLRAHREEALAYEAAKRLAAAAHPEDSLRYNDHKSPWIRACQERAAAWTARSAR